MFSGEDLPLQKQSGKTQFAPCTQASVFGGDNSVGIWLTTIGLGVISTKPCAAARGVVEKACKASIMS